MLRVVRCLWAFVKTPLQFQIFLLNKFYFFVTNHVDVYSLVDITDGYQLYWRSSPNSRDRLAYFTLKYVSSFTQIVRRSNRRWMLGWIQNIFNKRRKRRMLGKSV
jgi:hypothetical protein